MWMQNNFFAPNLPTWERYKHVEACHKIALFEWLIRWAVEAEHQYDDLYSCYPFACHVGSDPIRITLHKAQKTLVALLCEPDADGVLAVIDYEITKLANTLASASGKSIPAQWDISSFRALTDLSKYEP